MIRSIHLFLIGFICVVVGAVLPFLMILGILETTFFLSFLTVFISTGGVLAGLVAVAYYSIERGFDRDEM
jgi:hypothetical protein